MVTESHGSSQVDSSIRTEAGHVARPTNFVEPYFPDPVFEPLHYSVIAQWVT